VNGSDQVIVELPLGAEETAAEQARQKKPPTPINQKPTIEQRPAPQNDEQKNAAAKDNEEGGDESLNNLIIHEWCLEHLPCTEYKREGDENFRSIASDWKSAQQSWRTALETANDPRQIDRLKGKLAGSGSYCEQGGWWVSCSATSDLRFCTRTVYAIRNNNGSYCISKSSLSSALR